MKSQRARIVLVVAIAVVGFTLWKFWLVRFSSDAVLFAGRSPVESIVALDPERTIFAIHCADETAIAIVDTNEWPAIRHIETQLAKLQLLAALSPQVLLVRAGDRLANVFLEDPLRVETWGPVLSDRVVVGAHGATATVAIASPEAVTFLRTNREGTEFETLSEARFQFDFNLAHFGFLRLIDAGKKLLSVSWEGEVAVIDVSTGTVLESATAGALLGPDNNGEEFTTSVSVAAQADGDTWILTAHSGRLSVSALRTDPLRKIADMRARWPCFPAKAWAVSPDGTRVALVPFSRPRHVQIAEIREDGHLEIIRSFGLGSVLDSPTIGPGSDYRVCSRLHFQSHEALLIGFNDGTVSRQRLK